MTNPISEAYCENESIYGYGCGCDDCPHCGGDPKGNPLFQQEKRRQYLAEYEANYQKAMSEVVDINGKGFE